MTSAELIVELRRLHEAATKEPWTVCHKENVSYLPYGDCFPVECWISVSGEKQKPTAELIGMVRNNLPAIIAALEEGERMRKSNAENERQLVSIATYLKRDARHVVGDGEHSIATLVEQEFAALKVENARLRIEVERLAQAETAIRDRIQQLKEQVG